MTERRIPCRLISEVTVVVLFVFLTFFSPFYIFVSLSLRRKKKQIELQPT